jgi:hypothetical protein
MVLSVGSPLPVRSFQMLVDDISSPDTAVIAAAMSAFVFGGGAPAGHRCWVSH